MQSSVVFVAAFISLCLRRDAAHSRNPTATSPAAGNSAQNKSAAVGVELKHVDDTPLAAKDAPPKDVSVEVSEGSKVTHKWETGIFIVIAVITSLIL